MKKILLTTIAVAAFAQGASALEAGKMYARGDLGYNFSNFNNTLLSNDNAKRLKGFVGDIGFGYALSDSVRTDVTFNFSKGTGKNSVKTLANPLNHTADTTGKDAATKGEINFDQSKAASVSMTEKNIGLMANAYYDFNNASEFTPYVMAGFGVNKGKKDLKFSGKDSSDKDVSFTMNSKAKTTFAYQVGVGVGYEMSKDIHLDVAYKLVGHASTYTYKFKDNETLDVRGQSYNQKTPLSTSVFNKITKGKSNIINHTLTAGVRFAF